MEQLVVEGSMAQDIREVVAVSVCYEYLPEIITRHYVDNLLHTGRVKLVEDIIKQEYGQSLARCVPQELKLCQLERYDEGLVLPLTALASERVSVNHHLKVVTVNAVERVAYGTVPRPVTLYDIKQGATLAM